MNISTLKKYLKCSIKLIIFVQTLYKIKLHYSFIIIIKIKKNKNTNLGIIKKLFNVINNHFIKLKKNHKITLIIFKTIKTKCDPNICLNVFIML